MYSYVDSVYLGLTFGSKWEQDSVTQIHLDTMKMKDIFQQYESVFLILSHPDYADPIYADMAQFRNAQGTSEVTLADFLIANGNTTITASQTLPSTNVYTAKYFNAIQGSYLVEKCKIGMNVPVNYPEELLVDAKITRPEMDTDIQRLYDYCLVSVNGFYHRTDYAADVAYIYDGSKSQQKTAENHVGLYSFEAIGKVKQEQLTPDRIFSQVEGDPLKNRVCFRVEQDLTNKTVILVLGGYLILLETDVFWQSGDQIFCLDMTRINYIQRLFESENFIDLSSMNIPHPTSQMGPDAVLYDELWTDEKIITYLTLSQSFVAIIDNPNLEYERVFVRSNGVMGMLVAYQKPELPLLMGLGRQVEYWRRQERPYWSVSVADPTYRNYILSSKPTSTTQVINDHLDPRKPYEFARGFFLKLSAQVSNT